MTRSRAPATVSVALLVTLAGLGPGCGRTGFESWLARPPGDAGDGLAGFDGLGGGDPRLADPFATDPLAADPADPAGGDGGLTACLSGSQAIISWVFSTSSIDASNIITSVPDLAARAPSVELAGDGTTPLVGNVAALSGSSLEPTSVSDKDALIAALAGAGSYTVVGWAKTASNSQYGYIFCLWPEFSISEDHTSLVVTVGGSYNASFGQPFLGPSTEIFFAGGWDDGTQEVSGYAGGPLRSGPVTDFDPGSWVASDIGLFVGNDGLGMSPWHGDLRRLMIFDRVLSDAELNCYATNGPPSSG